MDDERARALELLKAAHQFPVEYHVSVITFTDEETFAALRAAVEAGLPGPLGGEAYQTIPSGGGKYTSHRFRVPCDTPEDVLALYERIRAVKGVVTVL
jgi:putative lipoic acid-binding regulatory protein